MFLWIGLDFLYRRVVVYSPQIYENFVLKSGEGLSIAFIVIWLAGDLCNLAGAWVAGLLPTMIILAGYVRSFPFLIGWRPEFVDILPGSIPFAIPPFSFKFTITGGRTRAR